MVLRSGASVSLLRLLNCFDLLSVWHVSLFIYCVFSPFFLFHFSAVSGALLCETSDTAPFDPPSAPFYLVLCTNRELGFLSPLASSVQTRLFPVFDNWYLCPRLAVSPIFRLRLVFLVGLASRSIYFPMAVRLTRLHFPSFVAHGSPLPGPG